MLPCDALNHKVVHQVHPLAAGDRAGLRPHAAPQEGETPSTVGALRSSCLAPTPAGCLGGAGKPVTTPAV